MPYTLVQHTGFTVGGKPEFKHAVEQRSVTTKKEERAIRRAGGVIYQTYGSAADRATQENFPAGYKGMIPKAPGKFVNRSAFDEPIYVPEGNSP